MCVSERPRCPAPLNDARRAPIFAVPGHERPEVVRAREQGVPHLAEALGGHAEAQVVRRD